MTHVSLHLSAISSSRGSGGVCVDKDNIVSKIRDGNRFIRSTSQYRFANKALRPEQCAFWHDCVHRTRGRVTFRRRLNKVQSANFGVRYNQPPFFTVGPFARLTYFLLLLCVVILGAISPPTLIHHRYHHRHHHGRCFHQNVQPGKGCIQIGR